MFNFKSQKRKDIQKQQKGKRGGGESVSVSVWCGTGRRKESRGTVPCAASAPRFLCSCSHPQCASASCVGRRCCHVMPYTNKQGVSKSKGTLRSEDHVRWQHMSMGSRRIHGKGAKGVAARWRLCYGMEKQTKRAYQGWWGGDEAMASEASDRCDTWIWDGGAPFTWTGACRTLLPGHPSPQQLVAEVLPGGRARSHARFPA